MNLCCKTTWLHETCVCVESLFVLVANKQNKQTSLMGYSPLLSFVVLVASVALPPSPSCSDFPDSGGADSWRCGRLWSSERLLTERQKWESHSPSTCYSIQKVIGELLTSSLCRGHSGADGGGGGSGSQCRCCLICVRGLFILPALVLV